MAASDYSATAASNTAISGIDITGATGLVKNGDNAIRQILADIKAGVITGYTTTATAAGTTTLTVASNSYQYFTGTTTQTVVMPVTSTLELGRTWVIVNNSTGALTINSSGSNLIITVAANTVAFVQCILTSGTSAASWDAKIVGFASSTGSGAVVRATSPTLTTPVIGAATGTSLVLSAASTASRFTTTRQAIADDGVYSQALPNGSVEAMVLIISNTSPSAGHPNGLYWLRGSTAPAAVAVSTSTNITVTTGALTGTTGVDTNTTLSIDSTTFYIENRTGSSKTYTLVFLG